MQIENMISVLHACWISCLFLVFFLCFFLPLPSVLAQAVFLFFFLPLEIQLLFLLLKFFSMHVFIEFCIKVKNSRLQLLLTYYLHSKQQIHAWFRDCLLQVRKSVHAMHCPAKGKRGVLWWKWKKNRNRSAIA